MSVLINLIEKSILSLKGTKFLIVVLLFIATACSKENNAWINRAFHQTTAKYNGYFNANEKIREAVVEYKYKNPIDYSELIPTFFYPDQNATSLYPAMDIAIEKAGKVINKHSMDIRGTEYNKWIDDDYYAMALAHFYKGEFDKAIEITQFDVTKYPDSPRRVDHFSLHIRTLLKLGEDDEAYTYLTELNKLDGLKRKDALTRELTNACFFIYREDYQTAAEDIFDALSYTKRRKNKIKWRYLLAQLYSRSGKGNEAIPLLRYVAKKTNNYDLAFAAAMLQARSVENSAMGYAVKNDLQKMLKDDKNLTYQDQIYYALAEVEWVELNYPKGLEYLKLSVETSVDNDRQKAKSYRKMADYYYLNKDYSEAKLAYDSTYALLDEKDKDKPVIKQITENLADLVVHLEVINKNDSLIRLYKLSDKDLATKLERIQDQIRREKIKEARRQKAVAAAKAKANSKGGGGTKGSWYFYNNSSKKLGKKEFAKKFGQRPLVDNWRVSSLISNTGFTANESEEGEEAENVALTVDVPSIEELSKDIPKDPVEIARLENQTMNALFKSGFVYKENFGDLDNAIEAFENLLARFDTTSHKLTAYYQLYRLYLKKENQKDKSFFAFDTKSSSFYYYDAILAEFPDSEFAKILRDPNYLENKNENQKKEDKLYTSIFELYKVEEYDAARSEINKTLPDVVSTDVRSRMLMLSAYIYAAQRDTNKVLDELTTVVNTYKEESVYPAAKDFKERLEKLLNKGKAKPVANNKPSLSNNKGADLFKKEVSGVHYYLIIMPKSENVNQTSLKNNLGRFHDNFFKNSKLSVTPSYLGNQNPILLIKTFPSAEEALKYYNAIEENKEAYLKQVASKDLMHFPLSKKNFIELFKNKEIEAYNSFFKELYGL